MACRSLTLLMAASLAGCAFADSLTAQKAQRSLVGLSELDLEACLGAPDQHSTFGSTDILTYVASSTSSNSVSLGLPIVGDINVAGGGYCHATFRAVNGHIVEVRYTGEKDATLAPNAYCAPIVRSCVQHPENLSPPQPEQPTSAPPPVAPPRQS
jgi:hypothetical protein